MLRRLVPTLVGCWLVLSPPSTSRAAEVDRIEGWAEPATFVPNPGPGIAYYELVALAEWERNASALGPFALRVVLPDGQIETQSPQGWQLAGSRRLTVYVRADAVRDLRPAAVIVQVSVIEAATGAQASNVLTAGIDEFPHPSSPGAAHDPGPFGWGSPLDGPKDQAMPLPRSGPDGWQFVRVPGTDGMPGFFMAITEATNAQVAQRLPGYDPRAGRSDEFTLEAPMQPAVGLTPERANAYLAALGQADRSGVVYRLPTRAEWLHAARAGRSSAFWWGDEATHPTGANFLGPEPALPNDTTAPSHPDATGGASFEPNPWGLFHTFGNVEEWAQGSQPGAFVRLGGHFRTEPQSPLPEPDPSAGDATGPDPYVGVRPAFDLEGEKGADLVRRALRADPRLARVQVAFDPDRATATLTGSVDESADRRAADDRLRSLWFLAAVQDQIEAPSVAPGQLATLGDVAGPVRRITPLGRWVYEVPLAVRWTDPLPVRGSSWWVNVYLPTGGHFAHRLVELEPDRAPRVTVLIDRARMASAGLAVDAPVSVALSLGAEAPSPYDPRVVSNVVSLRLNLR